MIMNLFFLFLISLYSAYAAAAEETTIIFQKRISEAEYATFRNVTVELSLWNVGDSQAFDVNVEDDMAEGFTFVVGKNSAHWDSISPNGHVSFNYTVSPTFHGDYEVPQAKVIYRRGSSEDAPIQVGYSTSVPSWYIMSEKEWEKFTAKHCLEWSVFAGGAALSILVPFLYLTALNYKYPQGIPTLSFTKTKVKTA